MDIFSGELIITELPIGINFLFRIKTILSGQNCLLLMKLTCLYFKHNTSFVKLPDSHNTQRAIANNVLAIDH